MARKRRGRGEGSIFQRDDGQWVGSISLGLDGNGKRKRRTVYGKTKKEVQDKLRELQNGADLGNVPEPSHLTVAQHLTRWLEQVVKANVAPSTYDRYELHVRRHVVPHIGNVKLTKLTSYHVEQLYTQMARLGDSAWEQQKTGKVLSQALNAAVRSKLIPFNPAVGVQKPRPEKREIQPLSAEQVTLLLKEARNHRLYALYVTAIDTGMRQGELLGLRWEDVDLENGSLIVRHSLEEIRGRHRLKEPKTKQARRRIDLSSVTMDVLHEHRKRMTASGYATKEHPVFCAANGGWLRKSNLLRSSFKPILKRAGVPSIRFHDLRHTCATLLLLANENVKVVSERLGHSTIQMTLDTYSHVLPTMQKRAAEKMSRFLEA